MTYDDPRPSDEEEVPKHDIWNTDLRMVAPGMLHCVFTKNDEPVGFVRIDNEEEYIWLNQRVTGIRQRN